MKSTLNWGVVGTGGIAVAFVDALRKSKRCRVVKDRIRLWKEGIRDLVMELCCALHNFRVRLTPRQPMI